MTVSEKSLLLFQLGPVQKFIAQAETIGDLRAAEANNQDSVGILVRSADGKVFRIAVSEVPQR
jgi:hypothetical protein